MKTEEKVREILYNNGVTENAEWMHIDSMQYIQILASIEEEFEIELPNELFYTEDIGNIEKFSEVIESYITNEVRKWEKI